MICHGQGDPGVNLFDGGCCWISGAVCPQRWFIDYTTSTPAGDVGTATILDHQGNSLGTVDDYVDQLYNGKPKKDRARQMIQGAVYVCGALANDIAETGVPTGANWQAEINNRWSATFDAGGSAEAVGDAWASQGKPRNWCVTYGPGENQCCFKEDQATNDAGVAKLHVSRVAFAERNMGAT